VIIDLEARREQLQEQYDELVAQLLSLEAERGIPYSESFLHELLDRRRPQRGMAEVVPFTARQRAV
jgi:hypothetical protein